MLDIAEVETLVKEVHAHQVVELFTFKLDSLPQFLSSNRVSFHEHLNDVFHLEVDCTSQLTDLLAEGTLARSGETDYNSTGLVDDIVGECFDVLGELTGLEHKLLALILSAAEIESFTVEDSVLLSLDRRVHVKRGVETKLRVLVSVGSLVSLDFLLLKSDDLVPLNEVVAELDVVLD